MTIRMAIVGYGKIAQDQHRPAILADDRYALTGIVAPEGDPGIGVPWFPSVPAATGSPPSSSPAT